MADPAQPAPAAITAAATSNLGSSPFSAIGRFSVRYRWFVVAAWIVAAFLCVRFLPSLSSVSNNDNSSFLPKNTPSIRAAQLAAPFERANAPSAVLIASRAGGPLTPADEAAITRIEQAAKRVANVAVVRDQGISGDGQARKALIAISARGFGQTQAENVVDGIRHLFAGLPPGLTLHLTGELATSVDNQRASNSTLRNTQKYSVILILVLLFLIFRSALAPLITLIPAGLVLLLAGPVIAEASKAGLPVSPITQIMLSVLLLGAGTDYGLFLVFRVREELRRGLSPHDAVVRSLARVGESITFSASTVIAALLCLLLATLGFYRGLGPALAIGVALMLLAGLTLLPALLAIFGRAAFWPSNVKPGTFRIGLWGQIAGRIVLNPIPTLVAGLVLFGGLALFAVRYSPTGFTDNGSTATTSDSAQGTSVLKGHFPAAQANPTNILFLLKTPVWQDPGVLARSRDELTGSPLFAAVNGPLDPNGTALTPQQLAQLHARLGPAVRLPIVPPSGVSISPRLYNAYRATAQFLSPDGRTVQYYTVLTAGDPSTTAAMQTTPAVRGVVGRVAQSIGAVDNGVAGQAPVSYDISHASTDDLIRIVPIVLVAIAVLLALVLRSLVAPIYLIFSVGLSYLAAIGLAVIVFVVIGGGSGLNFILPFLMFIFLMALGEDYNILVMSRIREEAHDITLSEAVTHAINATGNTVTSAGLILAGTFGVLALTGSGQIQQIGFSIAAGILLDTFLVRTLLIPSVVVLIGRWNWWPSRLSEKSATM
jgi:RND superfamily putative drug exporter